MTQSSHLTTANLWRYSGLAIPIAFAGFPLYVLAPDYYATTHGVSLSLLGILLLGLRLFDALIDPAIGALSDQYRSASLWYMPAASIMLCTGVYGLFHVPSVNPSWWFCICIALSVTGYSILSINLNALGGIWGKTLVDQTRISSLREACSLLGLVIAVSLPNILKHYVPEQQAYTYFSIILLGLMLCAWIFFKPWLSAQISIYSIGATNSYSLVGALKSISKPTWYFLSVYGLSMLASSIPAVLVIFFVRDLLHAENLTGVFLLLYFLSGAAAIPLWKKISNYSGIIKTWRWSMMLAVASFIWAFFLNNGDAMQYAVICIVSGFALGADLALPPAILANLIHKQQHEHHAATQYALLALFAKLALALASAIALPLLGIAGFTPATDNSTSALFFLRTGYALIPCILKLLAIVILWRIHTLISKGTVYENPQINRLTRSHNHA